MAELLFRLRHVTDEEAMEVRDLLAAHGFDTYETQAGFFRLGVDAIWLRNPHQHDAAIAALEAYQAERLERVQREHQAVVERGEQMTLWKRLAAHPLQVVLVLLAVTLIVALTLLPFLGLSRA
ncbi:MULTISPECIES: DUF6164 family protein [Halomonadaceae]|uniref:DUF2007 domain-containing protein n=1 Tax=Vreelandella titanicae TaxID=664683 RepID=A0A558J3H4_9GAMM|nr:MULTISPECIES: DUF6164 family protein [Halomonas]MBR9903068.1 hypothetical protein [Gammaproteobacteria bacterium]TVU88215.1 hypothetical protein FQP89_18340 [Halomonas titanicae]CEP38027.1 Putative uncharacterized protein [Halomonas sp. R57-5]